MWRPALGYRTIRARAVRICASHTQYASAGKAPSGAFSAVSTMDCSMQNMRVMLERRLRALCFLKSMLSRQRVHFGCANGRNSMDGLFRLFHFIADLGLAVSFPYSLVVARPVFATLRLSSPATAMTKRCAIGGVSYGAVFVSKDASLRAHQYTPWAINSRCLDCRK